MEKKFKALVNGTYQFPFSQKDIESSDAVSLDLENYHLLSENKSYRGEIIDSDFNAKKYTVSINGNTYQVDIQNDLDLLIKEMGFEVGSSKQVNAIKAPMPGLILEINVSEGQEVQEGDALLILEAMKMENSFYSPRSGTIKSIAIQKGQAVDKGQLLIEFE